MNLPGREAGAGSPRLEWVEVLEEEFRALHPGEAEAGPAGAGTEERLREVYERVHRRAHTALCLSGGGIRSATFALGVLQGLAHARLLGGFDYLSTVSGGGYAGGWFTAWLRRAGPPGSRSVFTALDPSMPDEERARGPIEYVRRTCRYLAPRGGIVSADFWTLVATLARNLLLNWLVILPLLAAALLIPRLYFAAAFAIQQPFTGRDCLALDQVSSWFLAAGIGFMTVAVGYLALNLTGRGGSWSQGRFLSWFLAPLIAGSVVATLFWASTPCGIDLWWTLGISAALPAAGWLVIGAVGKHSGGKPSPASGGEALRVPVTLRTIAAAALAGPVVGAGAYWCATYEFGFDRNLTEIYAVVAVPLLLALILVALALFAGFASRDLDDSSLEWLSRCGAWIGMAAAIWLVAAGIVFLLADGMDRAFRALDAWLNLALHTSGTVMTVLLPLASSATGLMARQAMVPNQPRSRVWSILQPGLLPAIIVLLLGSLAWANLRTIERLEYHRIGGLLCTPEMIAASDSCHPAGAGVGEGLMLLAALLFVGLVMSAFVPANRFSLHGMYRERLIRTFLGASRPDRSPNAFTGFDSRDDLRVHDLAGVRPLHIINTTLNAVSSTGIGRHERLAEPFTFSPLHVGNPETGYRRASQYGSDGGGEGTGISLGMALAVSGAAASPEMGMYSNKSRAFLLTLANARLGLWFGNPHHESVWQTSDPPLGLAPLVRELLGLTTDRNPYVYLSDGGHFENLGLWEMVARRCRFIVVSDAGCDPEYAYDDLANATRRIRLDLGIPILFPPMAASREGQGHGNPHGALGLIRYSAVDGPDAPDGVILYLKATLSGDEPVDVRNFATTNRAFPHDPTSDQFFDEARFESYRTLGFHTVLTFTHGYDGADGIEGLCDHARRLLADEAMPPPAVAAQTAEASA
jgi:hypothetical protein